MAIQKSNRRSILKCIFIFSISISRIYAQNWDSFGDGFSANPPFNPYVFAIEEFQGEIIAGGFFHSADTIALPFIAKWDGTKWNKMGSGLNNTCFSLQEFNNLLYVGGMFTLAGGINANGLAVWDGSNFLATNYPLQSSTSTRVTDMTIYNNELIVASGGGVFSFTGSSWNTITNASVMTLGIFNNELYMANSDTLMKWNGFKITPMPKPNSYIRALVMYKNKFFIGGDINTIGTDTVANLTEYNGSNFKGIANTGEDELEAMAVYKNQLFIGGGFTQFSGLPASGLVSWDGNNFYSHGFFGNGYRAIHCLKVIGNRLLIGGYFQKSNGAPGNCIAVFDMPNPPAAIIRGNVFHDVDSNCIYNDSIDHSWSKVIIKATPGPFYGYAGLNGNYRLSVPEGSYEIEALPVKYYEIGCPKSIKYWLTNIRSKDTIDAIDFGFKLKDTCVDLKITGTTYLPFKGCTRNHYIFRAENRGGGLSTNTKVTVTFPPEFTVYDTQTVYHTNKSAFVQTKDFKPLGNNVFEVKLGDIEPGYWRQFQVPYFISCDPSIHDKYLSIKSKIHGEVAECDYNNNNSDEESFTGSPIDPNNILVKAENKLKGFVQNDTITKGFPLEYQINFQNVGTAPAIDVVVIDTLNEQLNIETFDFISSSHLPVEVEIEDSNIIIWKFHKIMLPDSFNDESGSHGSIRFRINQKANLSPGMLIKNSAAIYFDLNEPVVTNNAISLIRENKDSFTAKKWVCYPNPTSGIIQFTNGENFLKGTITCYTLAGKLIFSQSFQHDNMMITTMDCKPGLYIIRVNADDMATQFFKVIRY